MALRNIPSIDNLSRIEMRRPGAMQQAVFERRDRVSLGLERPKLGVTCPSLGWEGLRPQGWLLRYPRELDSGGSPC
jgi:hypothetical protein